MPARGGGPPPGYGPDKERLLEGKDKRVLVLNKKTKPFNLGLNYQQSV